MYQSVIHSMAIFDEKRYPAACVEPPVPKCFLSQLDAQVRRTIFFALFTNEQENVRILRPR